MPQFLSLVLALVLTVPSAAFAHTGIGATHGFAHGFLHPFGGLDHVLTMVTVGLFAYQLGGRALWLIPASFVAVMAAGGALGVTGVAIPHVEIGIALSIIVLGVAVALAVRAPVAVAMGLIGFFAVFHGHVHGTEMPADVASAAYAAGFVMATALLHAAGLGLGGLIGRAGERLAPATVRLTGGAIAVAGLVVLAGAV